MLALRPGKLYLLSAPVLTVAEPPPAAGWILTLMLGRGESAGSRMALPFVSRATVPPRVSARAGAAAPSPMARVQHKSSVRSSDGASERQLAPGARPFPLVTMPVSSPITMSHDPVR